MAFELADVIEVAIESGAIGGAELAAHRRHFARDPVEDAAALSRRVLRSSAVPPAPNSMSKATRGSRIIGSGSFGDAQLIESV